MDNKVAFFVTRFIEILLGVDLEYVIAHLETNWFNFRCDILAAVFDVTECLV